MYDSRPDTEKHIAEVRKRLGWVIDELAIRSRDHDLSKFESPEKEIFDEMTPKLAATTYGSDEYKGYLAGMKVALDHHYAANSHHPEHYPDGIRGMSLGDITEMLMDWWAATTRHDDGCIYCSIEINQTRFGYGDDLKAIFINTIRSMEDAGSPGRVCKRCGRFNSLAVIGGVG
jgi:hypothetical protein